MGVIIIESIFNKHISKELRIQLILELYGGHINAKSIITFLSKRIDVWYDKTTKENVYILEFNMKLVLAIFYQIKHWKLYKISIAVFAFI